MARTITRPLADLATAADAVGRGDGIRRCRSAARASCAKRRARSTRCRSVCIAISTAARACWPRCRTTCARRSRACKLRVESIEDEALRERVRRGSRRDDAHGARRAELFRGLNDEEPLQAGRRRRTAPGAAARATRSSARSVDDRRSRRSAVPGASRTALKRCLGNLVDRTRSSTASHATIARGGQRRRARRSASSTKGPEFPRRCSSRSSSRSSARELAQRRHGGTGLGLSIARDIAQAHGGSLTLRNRSPHGLEADPAATEKRSQRLAGIQVHRAFSSIRRRSCFVRLLVCILHRIGVIRLELFQRLPRICR